MDQVKEMNVDREVRDLLQEILKTQELILVKLEHLEKNAAKGG